MNDTSPEIEEMFFNLMMTRSGEERLKMGFEMYEMGRKMVTASITNDNPDISEKELRVSLFNRFYGNDLTADIKQKFEEYFHDPEQQHKIFTELGFTYVDDGCDGYCPKCGQKNDCSVYPDIKEGWNDILLNMN